MQLGKNQFVVFPDGEKQGYLEARWSERAQAFYKVDQVDGEYVKLYSTDVREKKNRKSAPFTPTKETCTVAIRPIGETEKAYQVEDGTNGCISRGNQKTYYKYIAKSICYVDQDGTIYAPKWA